MACSKCKSIVCQHCYNLACSELDDQMVDQELIMLDEAKSLDSERLLDYLVESTHLSPNCLICKNSLIRVPLPADEVREAREQLLFVD